MALAGDSGSGSLARDPEARAGGRRPSSVLPRLDLDRWLAALAVPAAPHRGAGQACAAQRRADDASGGASVLDALTAKLSLEAAEVIYNKQPVRNVAIELDAQGRRGRRAEARRDPAGRHGAAGAARPCRAIRRGRRSPAISAWSGPSCARRCDWLAVDVSSVPANKLTRLSLKGRLGSNGGNVQVSDAVFELDDVKGSGGVVVTFSVPLSIVTQLEIDTIDLDSFLAKPADGQKKPPATAPATTAARPARGRPIARAEAQGRPGRSTTRRRSAASTSISPSRAARSS